MKVHYYIMCSQFFSSTSIPNKLNKNTDLLAAKGESPNFIKLFTIMD
jgi:hypothetical protein